MLLRRLLFGEAMWSRGGRSTRGGVQALITQYVTMLAQDGTDALYSFARTFRRADESQRADLCALLQHTIVGKLGFIGGYVIIEVLYPRGSNVLLSHRWLSVTGFYLTNR